jgi:hypothetical protein
MRGIRPVVGRDVVLHCLVGLGSGVSVRYESVCVNTILSTNASKTGQTIHTLFLNALIKSCIDLPSYFRYLPKFSINTLSNRECQSFPTTPYAPFSSSIRSGSRGSRHMISNRSDASCKNARRRAGVQKKGWSKHAVVSGLRYKRKGGQ